MCVEVFATYICNHTVPLWVPCSTFSMKACSKYQRQYRNRPLRCSCTCKAPYSLTEALQDNSFADGLCQTQFGPGNGENNGSQSQGSRCRDSMSPDTAGSPGSSTGGQTPFMTSRQPSRH